MFFILQINTVDHEHTHINKKTGSMPLFAGKRKYNAKLREANFIAHQAVPAFFIKQTSKAKYRVMRMSAKTNHIFVQRALHSRRQRPLVLSHSHGVAATHTLAVNVCPVLENSPWATISFESGLSAKRAS